MSDIQKIPFEKPVGRVETGPIQFCDDWPGVFIRGDNAAYYAMCIDAVLSGEGTEIDKINLRGLSRILSSCVVGKEIT